MAGHADIQAALKAAVAERVGSDRFGLWFGEGVSLGVSGNTLRVGVPNGFFREWIQGHFAKELNLAGESVTGKALNLAFHVDTEVEAEPAPPNPAEPEPAANARGKRKAAAPKGRKPAASISPDRPAPPSPRATESPAPSSTSAPGPAGRPLRRLEDFVTGPSNRMAHAAALDVIQNPGASFNPLVIHGGVGLGKTHLLEGIVAGLRMRHPGRNIIHTTAEAFTNSFLEAMRTGSLATFRSRFRKADVLIVDDVHFLTAKRATQDEFLHTFNALVSRGAAIVMASDQHPRRVPKLSDELATRFLAGMVVKVEAPDPATRKAILRAKANLRGVDVPDAVLAFVADHLRSSVRELEGALNSLIAHALLAGKKLDLNLARTALRDTIRHTAQAVGLKDVERAVCELFQVESDALKADGRSRAVSHPRMLAMYLARKHTGAAYSEIGRFFGGRNHSTVIAAEKKVKGWLADEQRSNLLAGFESVSDMLAALERSLGA
ncbi:MAG: chromosomal replication initiator protein DnaA [Isosphaeraceae bacterium]